MLVVFVMSKSYSLLQFFSCSFPLTITHFEFPSTRFLNQANHP